jgi:transposase
MPAGIAQQEGRSMMGYKTVAPKRLYEFSMEGRIPADHLLRQVSAVVDFSFVRRLTARFYSHTGQPGVDPVVLVKMTLVGYLYGITSERRLAEEVRLNLAFMWFLGYDLDERPPDHSVLSKARRRFGVTLYQAFFVEIVRQCERAGLILGPHLYLDSTLVRADASMHSTRSRSLLEQLSQVKAHLAAVWQENDDAPCDEPTSEPTPAPGAAPASPVVPAPGPHLLGPDDPPAELPGRVNDLAVSRTDPDAAVLSRESVPLALYHKVHVGVDGGSARIITAVEVTPAAVADFDLLDRLCKEHEGTTGRRVQEVSADGRYSTYEIYRRLEGRGIRASIPLRTERYRQMPPERFSYDVQTDRYHCPQGHPLTRQGISHAPTGIEFIMYRASPKVCQPCPLKAQCCGRSRARTLTPLNDGGLSERVRAFLRTPQARDRLRRRKCWVELAFAELKERHGSRRAHGRGRDAVLIQALSAAMAYNIKKLVRAARQQPQPIARAQRSGAPEGCSILRSRLILSRYSPFSASF